MTIDAQTRCVGLLGWPVAHSRSPLLHNAAFRALGLNRVYVACPVEPERLPAAVAGLVALGFVGANVTLPHKQAVLPLVDTVADSARAVGAANTLVMTDDGQLRAENTDVEGFLAPLAPRLAALHGAEVEVFGAGGAARAVVYALLGALAPTRLTLVARDVARAADLAATMAVHDARGALAVATPDAATAAVPRARLVVNATAAGMHPHPDTTPFPAAAFAPGQIAYDLVYAPAETRFLREAAARGAEPVGGLAMLVGQAAAAFRLWTGRDFPLDAVRAALIADDASHVPG